MPTYDREMRILLIEDSKFLQLVNGRALAKAGYTVTTASDGKEGVRAAREELPDLVLLDMMLPKISGLDVLRLLKGDSVTKEIPVIVLTALSERNKEKLLKEGAIGYVEKSDTLLEKDSAALVQAVARAMSKSSGMKR
jgi:CheY-like chemotaxis protein